MTWAPVKLGDLLTLEYGKGLPRALRNEGGSVQVAGSNGTDGFHTAALVKGQGIVVGRKGSAGKVNWFDSDFWPIDTTYFVTHDPEISELRWLYYLLQHLKLDRLSKTTGVPGLNRSDAYAEACLLPARSEQRRIVELLDEADRLRRLRLKADAKAARILSALFLKVFGNPADWAKTENLGQLALVKSGGTPSKSEPEFWTGSIPWVSPKDMKCDLIDDAEDHISESAVERSATQLIPAESVLIVVRGMILARHVPLGVTRRPVAINQDIKALVLIDDRLTPLFLFAAMGAQASRLLSDVSTAAHGTKKLDTTRLQSLPIPIPSDHDLTRFSSIQAQLLALDEKRRAVAPRVDQLFALLMARAFSGQLTASWRKAHMKELLAEMEHQARALNLPLPRELEATA